MKIFEKGDERTISIARQSASWAYFVLMFIAIAQAAYFLATKQSGPLNSVLFFYIVPGNMAWTIFCLYYNKKT